MKENKYYLVSSKGKLNPKKQIWHDAEGLLKSVPENMGEITEEEALQMVKSNRQTPKRRRGVNEPTEIFELIYSKKYESLAISSQGAVLPLRLYGNILLCGR